MNGEAVSIEALRARDIQKDGLPPEMLARMTQYLAARDKGISGPLAEQLSANVTAFETLDVDGSRSVTLGEVIQFFIENPQITDGNGQSITSWSALETMLANNNNQLPAAMVEQIANQGRQ